MVLFWTVAWCLLCFPPNLRCDVHVPSHSLVQLGSVQVAPSSQQKSQASRNSRIDVSKKLQARLENVTALSNELRIKIMIYTTGTGIVLFLVTALMDFLISNAVLSPDTFGESGYWGSMMTIWVCFAVIGVLPNDIFAIRILCYIFVVTSFLIGIMSGFLAAKQWFVERHVFRDHTPGDDTLFQCGSDLPARGCAAFAFAHAIWGVVFIINSFLLRPILQQKPGTKFYDRSQKKGFRFKDEVFVMPARQAQEKSWYHMRVCFALPGVTLMLYSTILYYLGDSVAPFMTYERFTSNLFQGSVMIFTAIVYNRTNRHNIVAFITNLIGRDEAREAAAIAGLLGNVSPIDSLKMAKEKFRAICFSNLAQDDFIRNTNSTHDMNTLYDKAVEIELGGCDVFLSHSWSDCGKKKFAALRQYARTFKQQHGREPKIWLDKACINQSEISSDLLCLPIFLAGCDTLLIIAGPTYKDRLWCILEMFVFLKMGGSIQRIKILPIDMKNEQEAKDAFDEADVSKCECFLESDRQKILGIVEQGFGNLTEFNSVIRSVFKDRMDSVQRKMSTMRVLRQISKVWASDAAPVQTVNVMTVESIE